MAEFKDILKKLRSENNMSQALLAEELHTGLSTVASWETGQRFPRKHSMEQLADIFNVDISYLYGQTDIRQAVHFDNDGRMLHYLDSDEADLLHLYRKLTDARKAFIMQAVKYVSDPLADE